ncbi:Glycosyltransferase 90 [Gracilaria domingensis]|nr:Glycosyltransferase 90 [Gracilaria domingensis]
MGTRSRRAVFHALVDEYLVPWSAPTPLSPRAPIPFALLDSMQPVLRGSVARVRLTGDGRILYRVEEHWEKTYRLGRLQFFLHLLSRVLKRYAELRHLHCEFYINTADGPRVTVDSTSQELGALPLFGFRTQVHFVDIPIPDPVEHGSKVTGQGYVFDADANVPWHQKTPVAVFRGVSSSIQKQHFRNWHLNPRVRVSSISSVYPHLLDAGVTKWIKLSHNTTVDDIERTANITAKPALSLEEHLNYKYILDVDGGLGSSRKRWMMLSGSVPFFQNSAVRQWYEPLLVPWLHYVPVDRWFRDLVENIIWARQNDHLAHDIAKNAKVFATRFLSDDAILEYLAVFLPKYSDLLTEYKHGNESVPDPCVDIPEVRHGPMGCGTGWFQYIDGIPLPFGCRHKPLVEGSFVCHRPHPVSGRKQVKHGVHEPYIDEPGIELPPKRPLAYAGVLPLGEF